LKKDLSDSFERGSEILNQQIEEVGPKTLDILSIQFDYKACQFFDRLELCKRSIKCPYRPNKLSSTQGP